MVDTPITKLSLFIIEKTLCSLIKPKSMKKINQQYSAGRSAPKNFLRPTTRTEILSQPKSKSLLPQLPEFIKECREKPRSLPLHFRWIKK